MEHLLQWILPPTTNNGNWWLIKQDFNKDIASFSSFLSPSNVAVFMSGCKYAYQESFVVFNFPQK